VRDNYRNRRRRGLAEVARPVSLIEQNQGRSAKARGVRFGWPKLTAHQRQEAFQRLANGETQADIAHTYAAHPATIGHVGEYITL
jgi:hypothetical protein